MNPWTFVTSRPRPAISGPTTQIIAESEKKNLWKTYYCTIILWACKPSLKKTDAYWSPRVACIQNIPESFFRKPFYALGEAGTQFIIGSGRVATLACFQIALAVSGRSPCKLTHSEMVWVCRRILFMFELWGKPRALEIFESPIFSFLN